MNITPPLAAALLMTATAAMAELPTLSNAPFNFGSIQDGGAISASCPSGDVICSYMTSSNAGLQGVQDMGSRVSLPAGQEWASPDCQRIPCNTVASAAAAAGKPAWDQAKLDKAIEEQKALTPDKTVVDLGNGTYALDLGDGTVSIGTAFSCGMPRKMTDAEKTKLAAQADKDAAKKAEKTQMDNSINRDNPNGGFSMTSNKSRTTASDPGATGTNSPAADSQNSPGSDASDESANGNTNSGGKADGADVAAMQASMTGGSASASSFASGSGSASGGGQDYAAATEPTVIKVDGNAAVNSFAGYTWRRNADVEANVRRGGEAVKAAFNSAGAGRINVDSTVGNGENLGKIQAVSNSADR